MNGLIPNNSKVRIKQGNIQAYTIAVCLSGHNNETIEYRIVWFSSGIRNDSWVYDFEIELDTVEKKKAGMVDYEDRPENLIEMNE